MKRTADFTNESWRSCLGFKCSLFHENKGGKPSGIKINAQELPGIQHPFLGKTTSTKTAKTSNLNI